jgi:pimeloyl-ACP methyl ester carboxylesterase
MLDPSWALTLIALCSAFTFIVAAMALEVRHAPHPTGAPPLPADALVMRWVSIGGRETLVVSTPAGGGPHLVFLHGFRDNVEQLIPILREAARRGLRMTAIDQPTGTGRGGELDDGALLPQLDRYVRDAIGQLCGGEPFRLVGHSLGGNIALRLAADPRLAVEGVFAIAPFGFGHPQRLEEVRRIAAGSRGPEMVRQIAGIISAKDLLQELGLARSHPRAARRPAPGASMRDLDIGLRILCETPGSVPLELIPAQRAIGLLWSLDDPLAPPGGSNGKEGGGGLPEVLARAPWADPEVWPAGGHKPHAADPERFVRLLASWCRRPAAARPGGW